MKRLIFLLIALSFNSMAFAGGFTNLQTSQKIRLDGFISRDTPTTLKLDTGSIVYHLNPKTVLYANPMVKVEDNPNREKTLIVAPSDILGTTPSKSGGPFDGGQK